MIGFIVDTEFIWGFQARIAGLSKTSPSFYYPPPTTFLGALAEVIAKEEQIGESEGRKIIERLSENLLAIGVRPLNCIPLKYEDINKIIMIRAVGTEIKSPRPDKIATSFDSPARGKTILSSLDSDAPALRWFLVFKDDKVGTILSEEHFWRIHRLGSKESRVTVINVKKFEPEVVSGKVVTSYSFPSKFVLDGVEKQFRWEYEVYVDPFNVKYGEKVNPVVNYMSGRNVVPFKIPILVTKVPLCQVECDVAYKHGNEVVVGCRR